MKTTPIFFGLLAAFACAMAVPTARAQVSAFRQGASGDGYTLPRTVVTSTLVVEREVVIRGPFAKYAAQYLGISGVAMTDKESYRIIDAKLGYFEEPDPEQTYQLSRSGDDSKAFRWLTSSVPSDGQPLLDQWKYPEAMFGTDNPFTDVGIDPLFGTTTGVAKSTEQMAADAAGAIFTLRQRRFDLVTGETADLGAGLEAAIREMNRIEGEYLALFIGKRHVQRIVKTISTLPLAGKSTAMVCRFSDSEGIVSESDLSGRAIVIELAADGGGAIEEHVPRMGPKGTMNVRYRIPEVRLVKLVDGQQELARERVPIFQLGQLTYSPVVY